MKELVKETKQSAVLGGEMSEVDAEAANPGRAEGSLKEAAVETEAHQAP
jgi:hypothetical protein